MKPARYTGIEPNRIMKDPADVAVRFALCFPDIYEVGMSYYGYFSSMALQTDCPGSGANVASRHGVTWTPTSDRMVFPSQPSNHIHPSGQWI
jgi:hypothetical protein